MKITSELTSSTTTLDFKGTVNELLNFLNINPETVLITRNDEVLTEDIELTNEDHINILSVVSGG